MKVTRISKLSRKRSSVGPHDVHIQRVSDRNTKLSQTSTSDKGLNYESMTISPIRFDNATTSNKSSQSPSDVLFQPSNKKQHWSRFIGEYQFTHCCCYCYMISTLALLLLGILIAAIILIGLSTNKKVSIDSTTVSSTSTSSSSSSSTNAPTTIASTVNISTPTTTASSSFDSCRDLRWNPIGRIVAGNGTKGGDLNQLADPNFIYIDANDTLYVSDHHSYRVQKWFPNATSGITIVDTGNDSFDHPESITFDKDGYMYLTGHNYHRVLRFPPTFSNGSTVAGQAGVAGSTNSLLKNPLGLAVDDQLNLYIAERDNQRVVKWLPSASSGIVMINTSVKLYGLLLSFNSSNQVHVSSEEQNAVYLWTFGSATPSVSLTTVSGSPTTLNKPRGIKYDPYGNLYVADKDNKRIVMYCVNSTIGHVVINGTAATPALIKPVDIAFDSQMNLYVSDSDGQAVIKYNRF